MMATALASFTAGTITASRASNATTLLVGRSIQGLGAGGITNLSEVILTDLVPLRLRGRYMAYLNSVWALGSTTGPVIGAAFAQKVTWVSTPFTDYRWISTHQGTEVDLLYQPSSHRCGLHSAGRGDSFSELPNKPGSQTRSNRFRRHPALHGGHHLGLDTNHMGRHDVLVGFLAYSGPIAGRVCDSAVLCGIRIMGCR